MKPTKTTARPDIGRPVPTHGSGPATVPAAPTRHIDTGSGALGVRRDMQARRNYETR